MAPQLAVLDEGDEWRIRATPAERVAFSDLVATICASRVVAATCGLREHLAAKPVVFQGEYDNYNLNGLRVGLDDAVRALLAADLRQADQLLGKCLAQLDSILKRKREAVTPNRRITTMQRRVVTDLRAEVEAIRLELVRVIARVET